MRTLILGGSGLISTETARACMELGHETIALTRGKTPFRVMDAAGRSLMAVVADRKDKVALKKVISEIRPEAIIDLICYEKQDMEDLIAMRNSALKPASSARRSSLLKSPSSAQSSAARAKR